MSNYAPTAADKFSFGPWKVGWQAVDVFVGSIRRPLDPVVSLLKLAKWLGSQRRNVLAPR